MIQYKTLISYNKEQLYDLIKQNMNYKFRTDFLNHFYKQIDSNTIVEFLTQQALINNINIIKSVYKYDKVFHNILQTHRKYLFENYVNSYNHYGYFNDIFNICFNLTAQENSKIFENITKPSRTCFLRYSELEDIFTDAFVKQWNEIYYNGYHCGHASNPNRFNDFTINLFQWDKIKGNSRILLDLVSKNWDIMNKDTKEQVFGYIEKIVQRKNFTRDKYERELNILPNEIVNKLKSYLFAKYIEG